jgi:hypothetical protein
MSLVSSPNNNPTDVFECGLEKWQPTERKHSNETDRSFQLWDNGKRVINPLLAELNTTDFFHDKCKMVRVRIQCSELSDQIRVPL